MEEESADRIRGEITKLKSNLNAELAYAQGMAKQGVARKKLMDRVTEKITILRTEMEAVVNRHQIILDTPECQKASKTLMEQREKVRVEAELAAVEKRKEEEEEERDEDGGGGVGRDGDGDGGRNENSVSIGEEEDGASALAAIMGVVGGGLEQKCIGSGVGGGAGAGVGAGLENTEEDEESEEDDEKIAKKVVTKKRGGAKNKPHPAAKRPKRK